MLRTVLRSHIRVKIGQARMSTTITLPTTGSTGKALAPNKSWKVQQVRETWRKHLQDRYHVGNSKFLSELGYDGLIYAADERQHLAVRNQATADRLRRAHLLVEYRVPTFGDLPEDVQGAALENAQ